MPNPFLFPVMIAVAVVAVRVPSHPVHIIQGSSLFQTERKYRSSKKCQNHDVPSAMFVVYFRCKTIADGT